MDPVLTDFRLRDLLEEQRPRSVARPLIRRRSEGDVMLIHVAPLPAEGGRPERDDDLVISAIDDDVDLAEPDRSLRGLALSGGG